MGSSNFIDWISVLCLPYERTLLEKGLSQWARMSNAYYFIPCFYLFINVKNIMIVYGNILSL